MDNDNIDEILLLPDTLPFKVEVLPTEETGTVKALEYDVNAWNSMQSNIEEPKFSVGDYVVFYTCDFNDISYDTEVYYGLVTKVDGDELTFTKTTKEAMAEAMQKALNLYLEQDVPGDVLLENIDTEELEMQVQKEVIESGWAKDALNYLAEATSHTQSYAAMAGLAEYSVTDSEGNPLSPEELKLMRGMTFGEDDIKVTVTLDKSSTYFNDGIRFAIQLEGEFSVDVQDSGELKIVLKASFAEELSVGLKINGDCKIGWKVIIPYLKELWVSTDIDLKSYSAVSVDVKLYTVEKEEKSFWEKLKGIKGMDKYSEIIDKISELEEKMSELSDEDKTLFDSYYNDAKNAWESAEIIFDGNKVSYEEYLEIREKLDETAASKQLRELLHLSDDEIDAGLSDLMDRYSEMLETESDWIELVNKEIIDKDIMVYIFAVKLGTNFVVKGNLNLAIGANMEYVVGKRYSLWIDLKNKKSGSSERDLLDEKFGFQFYIMGQLGLKMGVEVEFAFGIGSTKLASIGAAAEFGPYLELWGYFIYEYSQNRPANNTIVYKDEKMMGAIYLEFGLYLEVNFKAQVLFGLYEWQPTLVDKKWPLLTAGVKNNVYDFAYDIESDEVLRIIDEDNDASNGYTMDLPETYYTMAYMDLCEGARGQDIYPEEKFTYSISNSNFSINENGEITVNVPEDARYLEAELTINWIPDSLTFSKHGIKIVVPIVWTNLSDAELNETYLATLKVGSQETGYETIWSKRVRKNELFDLPEEDKLRELNK